jgi:hypothetical protein
MNFFVTLYIWTVVAATPGSLYRDWRPAGEFRDVAACQRGAAELNATTYRCIRKDGR